MGAAPQQHIHIQMPGRDQQAIGVARRDDGVAVRESDAQAAVGDDFGEGQVGRLDVVVAFYDLQVGG